MHPDVHREALKLAGGDASKMRIKDASVSDPQTCTLNGPVYPSAACWIASRSNDRKSTAWR